MSPDGWRFLLDENIGGRRAVAIMRAAGLDVVTTRELHGPGCPDTTWLAAAGEAEDLVITADRSISKNPLERLAVALSGVRYFIAPQLRGDELGALLVRRRAAIVAYAVEHPAPFTAAIAASGRLTPKEGAAELLAWARRWTGPVE